jgi:hypothetical protein
MSLATVPHPRGCPAAVFHHVSYVLFDEVCCVCVCVCVQLRIF